MDRPITLLPEELERLGFDPDEFRLAAKVELDRRKRAEQYLANPFLFYKYVTTPADKRHNLGAIHKEGLAWINDGRYKRRLILWPRGHLKTTTFTQSEAIRRVLLNPNMRILISSAKWDNAKRTLIGIKGMLSSPEFVELYGDLIPKTTDPKTYKNNDAELTLLNRTDMRLNQATFTTTGIDKEMTSQHYDLIIHDDLVARDNVSSTEMMDKVIQYYRDTVSLLDPKKEMWIIGTRWHPIDLYGFLIDGTADPKCRSHHLVAHVPGCQCKIGISIRSVKEDGKYIFPEIFDDEYMQMIIEQDQLDRYDIASQYYNNPSDPSTCWFRPSDIETALCEPAEVLTKPDGLPRKLVWYTAIDPAESTSSRACKTAAVAVGVDQDTGDWYVDWAEGRRVETPGFLELCIETYKRYNPCKFGMELNTRKSLAFSLKEHMLKVGIIFNIEELKPQRVGDSKRTKDERIKRLLPLFEFKKIHINRQLTDLLDELYTIPTSTSIDLSDALSYILDLVPPGMGYNKTVGPSGEIRLPRRRVGWPGMGY